MAILLHSQPAPVVHINPPSDATPHPPTHPLFLQLPGHSKWTLVPLALGDGWLSARRKMYISLHPRCLAVPLWCAVPHVQCVLTLTGARVRVEKRVSRLKSLWASRFGCRQCSDLIRGARRECGGCSRTSRCGRAAQAGDCVCFGDHAAVLRGFEVGLQVNEPHRPRWRATGYEMALCKTILWSSGPSTALIMMWSAAPPARTGQPPSPPPRTPPPIDTHINATRDVPERDHLILSPTSPFLQPFVGLFGSGS